MNQPFRKQVSNQVQFSISPYAPCPCGSNIQSVHCCLTSTGFRKAPAVAVLNGPTTGNRLEGCYAASLRDCSCTLSREHYVSQSLLRLLNKNKQLGIKGLPWSLDDTRIVGPDALASKILCDRHNSALSPFDSIAMRLFNAFVTAGPDSQNSGELILLSGHDVERWLLKTLCGLASSKSLILNPGNRPEISDYWLDILFGNQGFPDGQGLYVCRSIGHQYNGPHGTAFQAISRRDGSLSGIGCHICGIELILSMSGFPSHDFDGRKFVYRPMEIYTRGASYEQSTVFSWSGECDGGTITLSLTPHTS